MTYLDRLAGLGAAFGATVGLAWASTTPVRPYENDAAMLRLAWTARPERIETCRPQTAEELAKLPAHMRQPVVCTGESAAYRLQIRRNGTLLVDRVVHGGGWRRDRPLYIFQEVQQAPGDSSMAVTFERVGAPGAEGATRPAGADLFTSFLPPRLTLEQTFHFRPGEVILVTYDDSRRRLVAIRSDAR